MLQEFLDHLLSRISQMTITLFLVLTVSQYLLHRYFKVKQGFTESLNNWLSYFVYINVLPFFFKYIPFPVLQARTDILSSFFADYKYLAIFIILLVQDFSFYIGHRLAHAHTVFWAFHETHHSSEELNFSTASRMPWLSPIANKVVLLPFLMLYSFFDVPADIANIAGLIGIYYPFFNHCGYMLRNRYISKVLITPHDHALHHERSATGQRSNYGNVFSVFDHMFGTYNTGTCSQIYGCEGLSYKTSNAIKFQLYPLVSLYHTVKKQKGLRPRLRILLLGRE